MQLIKLTILTIILSLTSCKSTKYDNLDDGLYAEIQTNKGDILLKLEYENTPITVANFVSLAEGTNSYVDEKYKDKRFYDGLKFHRIVKDFMIQGGDPRGNGSGNPGYKFGDEFPMDEDGNLMFSHDKSGMLSMANSGPETNGSQFFITHKETPFLDGKHTIFGHLIEGQAVVDSIQKDDLMNRIEIIRIGKNAKDFDAEEVFNSYFDGLEEEKRLKLEQIEKAKANLLKLIEDKLPNAKTLASGLKIISLKNGNGVKPTIGTKVPVYYAGYFKTGDLFDTNVKEIAKTYGKYDHRKDSRGGYQPSHWAFSSDAKLIAGFKEGLQQMNFGDKVLLVIPSHLAYGKQGSRGVIPPNTDLYFQIEIVDSEKGEVK